MKRAIAFCLLIAIALTMPAAANVVSPMGWAEELAQRRANADHHDEIFYYDADGNILCPMEGVVCAYGPHQGPNPTIEPGDVVHDGVIDAKDALWVLRACVFHFWGWWLTRDCAEGKLCMHDEVIDVNNDGRVDAKDPLLILQYAVGKIDSFPRAASRPAPVTPTDAP